MRNDATITFRLPHEEKEAWEIAAAEANVSVGQWIRMQVAEAIDALVPEDEPEEESKIESHGLDRHLRITKRCPRCKRMYPHHHLVSVIGCKECAELNGETA